MTEANAAMIEGYRDGFDRDSLEPGPNRSEAYHHGFANGCDDLRNKPRDIAVNLRFEAERILAAEAMP